MDCVCIRICVFVAGEGREVLRNMDYKGTSMVFALFRLESVIDTRSFNCCARFCKVFILTLTRC